MEHADRHALLTTYTKTQEARLPTFITSYYVVHKRRTNFELQSSHKHVAEELNRLCYYAVCLGKPFVMLRWFVLPLPSRSNSPRKVNCLNLIVKAIRSLQT